MVTLKPIPELPSTIRDAAIRGTLIPFVGAGTSRIAGCPNWSEFADAALRFFVKNGRFTHGQLAQLSNQHPRVKLSIALGLQREHGLPIDFEQILYPNGRNTNKKPQGKRLYENILKLGKVFVTTNYDEWLDVTIDPTSLTVQPDSNPALPTIETKRNVFYHVNDLIPGNLNKPNSVFHLHGSMHYSESMILTTQHYVRHYANDRRMNGNGKENNVLTFLEFLFKERNVLFIGYGLEELEILEYVIGKARLTAGEDAQEIRHFLLQGFFSHESQVAQSLESYYRECGIQLLPFLRDHQDWLQLPEILEQYAQLAPAGLPLKIQALQEMEVLLNG